LDGFKLADLDLQERREGDVLGLSQSGRPITLRFLSLSEHLDVILAAREFCESLYERNPAHSGMTMLAAQFTDTDRVEYLDKA
jgi:ATP-dependent DNA helicase RecG